jgi:hypothetical protein
MKQELTKRQFHDAFKRIGRGEQFSYAGLNALYDYLDDIDPFYSLDIIALCCEFTEYESLKEFREEYGEEYDSIDKIEYKTVVIHIPNSDSFIAGEF